MGVVTITDTGLKTLNDGNQELDYVSNPITLYNASIIYSTQTIIDDTAEVNNFRSVVGDTYQTHVLRRLTTPTLSVISFKSPTITITGVLDSNNADDNIMVGLLNKLSMTKGLKLVNSEDVINYLYYDDYGLIEGVYCFIKSFSITKDNSSENLMKYTIVFEVEQPKIS